MANILRTIRFRSILLPSTSILLSRYIAPAGNSISMIRQKNQGPETPNALSTSTYKTVPNLLCGLRIAASPVIGWLVINEMYWPACLLFTATGLTDLLDGLIARHFPSQRSLFGSIIDPVADKILINTLFVTLTYMQFIPVIVTVIVLCRDFCLLTGGLIVRYRMLEPPITFRRFFDPTISSIRIMPSKISKLNTILQMVLVSASLASTVFNFAEHPALTALQVLTVSTTVYSGIQYAFRSGILRENMRKRRNL